MTFDFISFMQVLLTISGMYCINTPKYAKYGCLIGVLAQPFWFITAFRSGEVGVLITTTVITGLWIKGVYEYWIAPKFKGKRI